MTPRTAAAALQELQDEVTVLRSTILHLERRIIEKQRAMAEIAASGDWTPIEDSAPLAIERVKRKRRAFTLTDACREVVAGMNGDTYTKPDFKRRIRAAHPELGKSNIASNVRNSLEVLLRTGELLEVAGGYTKPHIEVKT